MNMMNGGMICREMVHLVKFAYPSTVLCPIEAKITTGCEFEQYHVDVSIEKKDLIQLSLDGISEKYLQPSANELAKAMKERGAYQVHPLHLPERSSFSSTRYEYDGMSLRCSWCEPYHTVHPGHVDYRFDVAFKKNADHVARQSFMAMTG